MRSGHVMKQHLQVLQSGRPLDAPWHDAPMGAVGMLQNPPEDLFAGVEAADVKRLQEVVRAAEFWIALMEGERTALFEEVGKHKQRHQLALRQADTQAKAMREADTEKKRLEKELKMVRILKDDAICERAVLKEDTKKLQQSQSSRKDQELSGLEVKVRELEEELEKERREKEYLEENFVKTKVKHVDALMKVDHMEILIGYYADQLKALDPAFEPVGLESLSQWIPPRDVADQSDVDSVPSANYHESVEDSRKGKKKKGHGFKQAASKVRGFFRKEKKDKMDNISATPRGSGSAPSDDGGVEDESPDVSGLPRWMLRSD